MAKVKHETTLLRERFYRLSDGVYGLKTIARHLGDEELVKLVDEAIAIKDRIHEHLEYNYIWD